MQAVKDWSWHYNRMCDHPRLQDRSDRVHSLNLRLFDDAWHEFGLHRDMHLFIKPVPAG
jgi:hypothetical protein